MRSAAAVALLLAGCTSSTPGGGGAPTTSSGSATGGAAPISTTSNTTSGTGGAAGSTNSGGTGGATGSTSSLTSGSGGTTGSTTSSTTTAGGITGTLSTASGSWGTAALDCAALSGKAHGSSLWSTTFATHPPEYARAPHLEVDAAGHTVVAMIWTELTPSTSDPTGVEVHRIDPAGTELSQAPGIRVVGQDIFPDGFDALGPGRFAVAGSIYTWNGGWSDFALATDTYTYSLGTSYSLQPTAFDLRPGASGDAFIAVENPTAEEASITRLDAAGQALYTRALPSPGMNVHFRYMAPDDAGGVLFSGHYDTAGGYLQADLGCGPLGPQGSTAYTGEYVASLDAQGNCRWSRATTDTVAATPAAGGGAFLHGLRFYALDLGCGALPASSAPAGFLGFVDAAGACQWSREAGTRAPTVLPGAGLRVLGPFTGTLDLGCGPLDAGAAASTYLAAFGAAGACQWSRDLRTSSVTVTGASGPYLWGSYQGALDLGCGALPAGGGQFVAVLDAAGVCLFSEAIPATKLTAEVLDSGELLISAPLTGTVDLGCGPLTASGGALLALLGPTTPCVWSRAVAAPAVSVFPLSSGELALTASNAGTVDLGTGTLPAAGTRDLVVAKLDAATGQTLWVRSFGAPGADLGASAQILGAPGGVMVVRGGVIGTVDLGGGPVGAPFVPVACTVGGPNTCPLGYCGRAFSPGACCRDFFKCCDLFGKVPADCAPPTAFLVALDATGAFLWQREGTRSVALDPCGAVIAATHDEPSQLVGSVTVERLVP
jgi:hypothetical protein